MGMTHQMKATLKFTYKVCAVGLIGFIAIDQFSYWRERQHNPFKDCQTRTADKEAIEAEYRRLAEESAKLEKLKAEANL